MSLDNQVRAVEASLTAPLALCIVDRTPDAALPRLGGEPGCERPATKRRPVHVRPITFAGRQWEIRVRQKAVAGSADAVLGNAWPFSIVGLLATAMVGALLLTMTGRARRIELAVSERTADRCARWPNASAPKPRCARASTAFATCWTTCPSA